LNELIDVMDEKQLDYVMKRIKETSEKNKWDGVFTIS
jgi:hypothetical protein